MIVELYRFKVSLTSGDKILKYRRSIWSPQYNTGLPMQGNALSSIVLRPEMNIVVIWVEKIDVPRRAMSH
jgi:hypothetical protein